MYAMHRRRPANVLTIRITVLATLALTMLCLRDEVDAANAQCKITMLRFTLKKCMINRKIKRDAMDGVSANRDYERAEGPSLIGVTEPLDGGSRRMVQKRQSSDVGTPIALGDTRDAFGVNGDAAPRKRYREAGYHSGLAARFLRSLKEQYESRRTPGWAMQRYFGPSARYPRSFRQGFGAVSTFSPSVSEDLLGFDLSAEELEELYNEIYERLPRDFDETLARLEHAATKCCQNLEACKKDPNYISCSKI